MNMCVGKILIIYCINHVYNKYMYIVYVYV